MHRVMVFDWPCNLAKASRGVFSFGVGFTCSRGKYMEICLDKHVNPSLHAFVSLYKDFRPQIKKSGTPVQGQEKHSSSCSRSLGQNHGRYSPVDGFPFGLSVYSHQFGDSCCCDSS